MLRAPSQPGPTATGCPLHSVPSPPFSITPVTSRRLHHQKCPCLPPGPPPLWAIARPRDKEPEQLPHAATASESLSLSCHTCKMGERVPFPGEVQRWENEAVYTGPASPATLPHSSCTRLTPGSQGTPGAQGTLRHCSCQSGWAEKAGSLSLDPVGSPNKNTLPRQT